MTTVRKVASLLPPRVRTAVYSVLFAVWGLELIWDVLDSGVESKVLQSLTLLGFGMAAGNVPRDDQRR